MSKGTLNRVMLIGNVGRDPEIKHTETGFSVANLSIATTDSYKDKSTGENVDKTEWHRVVLFGKLVDLVEKYVSKGSKLLVEGALQTRKWTDKVSGEDKYATEIVAQKIQFMGGKSNSETSQSDEQSLIKTQNNDSFDDDVPF